MTFLASKGGWRRAFTLIEIMIVIGIIAMIAAIGIPTFAVAFNRTPMRQAVLDVMDALRDARRMAIEKDAPADFVLNMESKSMSVVMAPRPQGDTTAANLEEGGNFNIPTRTLGSDIVVEQIASYGEDLTDLENVHIRFYPNGTSDDLLLILRSVDNEYHFFTLEIVTGLASSEPGVPKVKK